MYRQHGKSSIGRMGWVRRGRFPRLWPGLGLGLPAGASRDLVGGDVQLTVLAAGGNRHTDTPDTGVLDHATMLLREG